MQTITRPSSEVTQCLLALQEELTDVLKILAKRTEPVTIELPGNPPTPSHISSPCNGGKKKGEKGDVQRALADVFVAVAKAVTPNPPPRK